MINGLGFRKKPGKVKAFMSAQRRWKNYYVLVLIQTFLYYYRQTIWKIYRCKNKGTFMNLKT